MKTRLHEQVGSGDWSVVGTYASTVTSKSFAGKAAGTYRYQTEQCVTVFSSTSCWEAAGPVSVTVKARTPSNPPDAPAKPTVTAGNTYLSVTWSAPDDNGSAITDYDLHYRAVGATSWTNHPLRGTGTRTTLTGLVNGTTYQLQVRAQNAAGESAYSATARGTPVATGTLTVSPTTSTDGDYTVRWTGARCFRIPFGGGTLCRVLEEQAGGSWAAVSGIAATATSKAFTGKAPGTYSYRLLIGTRVVAGPVSVAVGTPPKPTATLSWSPASVAYGASSTLSWSSTHATACYLNGVKRSTSGNWLAKDRTVTRTDSLYCTGAGGTSTTVSATLTVGSPPDTLPDAPAKPTLTGGVLEFTADWTAPADNGSAITGYGIRYRRGTGNWQDEEPAGTATRATVTVSAAGTYTVHVRAKNGGGWSGFSPGATVIVTAGTTPPATPPPATPAAPTGPATSTGTHTIRWAAATGATSYQVQSRQDGGSWTVHARQGARSRTFSKLEAGRWDYQVRACNLSGQQCSGWSSALSITVAALRVAPATSTDGDYTVSWVQPAAALARTRLWERTGTAGAWAIEGLYPRTTTSKAFTDRAPGVYEYKSETCLMNFYGTQVRSCEDAGGPVRVTVSRPPATPAAPTGPARSTGTHTVTW
ncbi:MAG: fibronectin type III domain-containing protein, partial [Gammaproteobacteria bacterium]|nr:fibronectin type III domain-containing protein [Gammaproteobacteria bacterium]